MRDRRPVTIRRALDALLEAVEASVRIHRWSEAEEIPAPLVRAAKEIAERRSAAEQATSMSFDGSPADAKRVAMMIDAMKRLEAAYAAWRTAADAPDGDPGGAGALLLIDEIDRVKNEMDS